MALSTRSMRSGALRHQVTLQRKQKAADGLGGSEITWEPVVTVPGAIEPLSGRELVDAEQTQFRSTHRITIRYDAANIPAKDQRFFFEGRKFYIVAVLDPDERHVWLECRTEERAQD